MIFKNVMRKLISSFSKPNHDAAIKNSSEQPFEQIAASPTNVIAPFDRRETVEESLESDQSTTTLQEIEIVEDERASSNSVPILSNPISKVLTPPSTISNSPTEDKAADSKVSDGRFLESPEFIVTDDKAMEKTNDSPDQELTRKHISSGILELEDRFQKFPNDLNTLYELKAELAHRKTKRARQLALKVLHEIGRLEVVLKNTETAAEAIVVEVPIDIEPDKELSTPLTKELNLKSSKGVSRHGVDQESDATEVSKIGTIAVEKFVHDYKVGDQTDPVSLLLKAPVDMRNVPIWQLKTTVRLSNLFEEHKIQTLGDLSNLTSASLLTWPRMGNKSLQDLSRSIFDLAINEIQAAAFLTELSTNASNETPIDLQTEKQVQSQLKLFPNSPNTSWFDSFCQENPLRSQVLKDLSIVDEYTYADKWYLLDDAFCDALDDFKFNHLKATTNIADPIELLKICPPWLLEMDIEHFSCLVRTKNAFELAGFRNLNSILNITLSDLQRLPNFGRKSIEMLPQEIQTARLRGRPPTLENPEGSSSNLFEDFKNSLQTISNERYRTILERRLGYFCETETLEQIGEEFSITRERIRQIQAKATKEIIENEFWDDTLNLKLASLIKNSSGPLYLESLAKLDPWFCGFEGQYDLLANVIDSFSGLTVNFLKFEAGQAISTMSIDQWREVARTTLESIESTLEAEYNLEDIEMIVESKLSEYNSKNLSEILFDEISPNLNFSSNNGEITLTSLGNSISSRLAVILEESETPLHYSEAGKLYEERFGVYKTERSIHAALSLSDFLLFDRGTFGVERHLPVTLDKLQKIAEFAASIANSDSQRQWHCSELLDEVQNVGKSSELPNFDKYILNIGLKKFSELKNLGRLVWISDAHDNVDTSRLFIKDAIPRIIRDHGAPMTAQEITEELRKSRGIDSDISMYLSSNSLVAKTAPGRWGLLSRDFEESSGYWEKVVEELCNYLQLRDAAIHKTEIVDFLDRLKIDPKPKLNLFLGFLSKNENFKTWKGGFIGLASQVSPNRLSTTEGLDIALESEPNKFTIEELNLKMSKLVSHRFSPTMLPKLLNERGYIYDLNDRVWVLAD